MMIKVILIILMIMMIRMTIVHYHHHHHHPHNHNHDNKMMMILTNIVRALVSVRRLALSLQASFSLLLIESTMSLFSQASTIPLQYTWRKIKYKYKYEYKYNYKYNYKSKCNIV